MAEPILTVPLLKSKDESTAAAKAAKKGKRVKQPTLTLPAPNAHAKA